MLQTRLDDAEEARAPDRLDDERYVGTLYGYSDVSSICQQRSMTITYPLLPNPIMLYNLISPRESRSSDIHHNALFDIVRINIGSDWIDNIYMSTVIL